MILALGLLGFSGVAMAQDAIADNAATEGVLDVGNDKPNDAVRVHGPEPVDTVSPCVVVVDHHSDLLTDSLSVTVPTVEHVYPYLWRTSGNPRS